MPPAAAASYRGGGALPEQDDSGERAYFDWNASAPLRPEARAAMVAALDATGNASSVHAEGRRARA